MSIYQFLISVCQKDSEMLTNDVRRPGTDRLNHMDSASPSNVLFMSVLNTPPGHRRKWNQARLRFRWQATSSQDWNSVP